MKQIADRGGDPDVFDLGRALRRLVAARHFRRIPDDGWSDGNEFVFRLRKLKNLKS